jgi:hypothetical protein
MATDVAVVAGMLPGHGGNYHIESCCRLEIASQWVTALSRPLDWMKRIGYQDRWVPSMCGLVGDHCFGLVGRAVWADARRVAQASGTWENRLVIGPVAGPKDGSQ